MIDEQRTVADCYKFHRETSMFVEVVVNSNVKDGQECLDRFESLPGQREALLTQIRVVLGVDGHAAVLWPASLYLYVFRCRSTGFIL